MSEAKHTPGPWHSFQQADGTRFLVVSGDGSKPNEPVVASVAGYTATMHAAEEANARLIAAAPDLLAACRRIEAWFDGCIGRGELRPNVELDAIRAAIAKAGGAA